MSEYRVLIQGVKGIRKLYPISENFYDVVGENKSKDWYQSLFIYNNKHKEILDKTHSLAGITDVTTDLLVWDFDNKTNLEQAKSDANILCSRFIEMGINQEDISIAFSGQKGFSVVLKTNKRFSVSEFKNINLALAKDLKSNDTTVADSQRIFRIIGTKHNDTSYYKFPLTLSQLAEMPVNEIQSLALDMGNVSDEVPIDYGIISLPERIYKFRGEKPVEPKIVIDAKELDFSCKPRGFTNCRFAIMSGFFPPGSRDQALMVLAATCRMQGYPKLTTYNICKAAIELQSVRHSQEPFKEEELKNNIVNQVFLPSWKGGTFTCRKDGWLKDLCEGLGRYKCGSVNIEEGFVSVEDIFKQFEDYSVNIEKNTIKTGIEAIDRNIQLTVGMPVGLLGAPSSGKCLGKDTPILMYNGSVKMVQDIKVGDVLMGDDSTPRNVLTLARGREDLYRVHQSYGDTYVVNESHILSLRCGASMKSPKLKKKYIKNKICDVDVKTYLQSSNKFKKYYKGYKVGVEYQTKKLLIDPYIFGYWLGNGTSAKPEFSVHRLDNNVCNKIKDYSDGIGLIYNAILESKNCYKINVTTGKKHGNNIFLNHLNSYNVIKNKHIPKNYLLSDRNQRLQLLAGLIDSDGYYDKSNNAYEVTFKQEHLSKELVLLATSLGFRASCNPKKATWNSFTKGKFYTGEGIYYRVYIGGENLNTIPSLLERKKACKKKSIRDATSSTLKLENIGVGDYYGFEIDGNKRFLLGDFTVTHNTSLSLNILNNTSKDNINSAFFSLDMYAPLVYAKQIQKQYGITMGEIHHIFKHDKKKTQEIYETISNEYKNVKFSMKAGISVQDMRNIVSDHEQDTGNKLKLVLVDYLECLRGPYSDATANTQKIAGELRDFATETNTCVIVLVQPPKSAGDASSPLYSMRQVKGSSMLEQSFRAILGIYREGFSPTLGQDWDKFITINSLKNTMGSLFSEDLSWDGLTGAIRPLDDEGKFRLAELRNMIKENKSKEQEW